MKATLQLNELYTQETWVKRTEDGELALCTIYENNDCANASVLTDDEIKELQDFQLESTNSPHKSGYILKLYDDDGTRYTK